MYWVFHCTHYVIRAVYRTLIIYVLSDNQNHVYQYVYYTSLEYFIA